MNFDQNGSCDQKMLLLKYFKGHIFFISILALAYIYIKRNIIQKKSPVSIQKINQKQNAKKTKFVQGCIDFTLKGKNL